METVLNIVKASPTFYSDHLSDYLSETRVEEFQNLLESILKGFNQNETVFSLLKLSLKNNERRGPILLRAYYSFLLASEVSWSSPSLIQKVVLGSMFCDIGKNRNKNKSTSLIDQDHPSRGLEILDGIGFESESIKQIVFQHHESMLGDGYPSQIRGEWIYPPARIVALADRFVQIMCFNFLNPHDAFATIVDSDLYKQFDPELIETLRTILEQ